MGGLIDDEEFGSRTFWRCRLLRACVNQSAGIFGLDFLMAG